MAIDATVHLNNTYGFSVGPVVATAIPTNVDELQPGLVDVTAFISADNDYDDAAIHASLSVTLTERGTTGIYCGSFAGADISTRLAIYLGQTVYLHIKRQQDFHKVFDLLVAGPRAIAVDPTAYLDNDYRIKIGPVTAIAVPAGTADLQAGLTDIVAFFSVDDDYDDVAINAAVQETLAEDGTTAVYSGIIEGSAISTHMAALVGQTAYLHIKRAQIFHAVAAVAIADPRAT